MPSIVPSPLSAANGTRPTKGKVTPIEDTGGMQYHLPPSAPPVSGYILNPPNLTMDQLEAVWGDSGTQRWSGFFYEEPNAQMRDWDRIELIEEMRRMDGAVKAALTAVKAPILATDWRVEGEDEKIVEFVEENLFKMRRPWKDFVRESHTYLDFGFSIFEKIWEKRGEYICLADLEPRIQHSIFRFRMSSGAPGVTQVIKTDEFPRAYAEIPAEKLVILTNEKEGDDITGQSILRAAYKHYHFKDVLYRIQGIAAERNGVGTPVVKLPDGFGDAEKSLVEEMLANYRSNEKSYLVLPPNYEVDILVPKGNAHGASIEAAITHHNNMILQTVLATFLSLGTDGTGSFALSKDLSSFFLKVVEDKCGYFASQINKQVIEPLVKLNFGPDADVPELKFSPLGDIDFNVMSQSLKNLADAGLIKIDGTLEQFIHKLFKLPEISDEDVTAIDDAEVVSAAIDSDDVPEERPVQPNAVVPGASGSPQLLKPPTPFNVNGPANPAALPANQFKGAKVKKNNQDKEAKPGEELAELLAEKAYKPSRELTLQEKRGDFAWLNDQFNKIQNELGDELDTIGSEASATIATDARGRLDAGDYAAIGAVIYALKPRVKAAVKKAIEASHTAGADLAVKELTNGGIKASAPGISPMQAKLRDVQVDDVAENYADRLENTARGSAVAAAAAGAGVAAIASSLRSLVKDESDRMASNIVGSVVGDGVNAGRKSVFDAYSAEITQYQRSEVIDDVTCALCLSLDGRVLSSHDPQTNVDTFHDWCRGVWVPILAEDEQLEPDPIPASVMDNIDTIDGVPVRNGFTQLKKAVTATPDAKAQAKANAKKAKK